MVANTWLIFQPLLFGLIGAEVEIKDLSGPVLGLNTIRPIFLKQCFLTNRDKIIIQCES